MKLAYIHQAEPEAIEQLYRDYLSDPMAVEPGWRLFFEGFEFARGRYDHSTPASLNTQLEFRVINLITDYRQRGHLFTLTNPVRKRRKYTPTLDIENHGLSEQDLDTYFEAGYEIGIGRTSLRNILDMLRQTYCRTVGAEFMFIRNREIVAFLLQKMESTRNTPSFAREEKQHILKSLADAVLFEQFLHRRFPGQKRFSLEGAEAIIPALDSVIKTGAQNGAQEIILGMAHRGRLNVLANFMQKPVPEIFGEFMNKEVNDDLLLGDVKYHLGFTSKRTLSNSKEILLSLCPNPSHLETINPIVEGIARARIDHVYGGDKSKVVPVLIHGDASIAGQGVVYEVLQMSGLEGYSTGGTIHIVINNQIGFTTDYLDARTSIYCTDIAKTIQSPVFHVNGDDVEAVVFCTQLAMEFRARFNRDVFIDLLCYRKYGHNEGDEPRFTQPVLYKTIEKHPDPFRIYSKKLIADNDFTHEEISSLEQTTVKNLDDAFSLAESISEIGYTRLFEEEWKNFETSAPDNHTHTPATAVSEELLLKITHRITQPPANKTLFRKLIRLLNERRAMVENQRKADWATCELLAYGTLLSEGVSVRLSGQDSQRGTFSHRHAVLTIEDSEEKYVPLNNISENQAQFTVINSPLSEYGVLGFEYGYALAHPVGLTIWEAQFGDFSNGAQIIIDQYLSSAEEKWRLSNGVVLLLPHGYEGQGPEHSSARIERFLSLCANNNMQLVSCSTPANFFHLLRRQIIGKVRKPLIVFTPKSLLRHPECISPLDDLTNGGFQEVIGDSWADPAKVRRVVMCTGKLFYDLDEERRKLARKDVALIRIEQLYPFPEKQLNDKLSVFLHAETFIWAQEEPANMGAWTFISRHLKNRDLLLVARPESGSPATGFANLHSKQQQKIIEKVFGECSCPRLETICTIMCAPAEWQNRT